MKRGALLPIIYADESLVAVDKPAGLLVHRSPEAADRVFLLQELREQLGCRVYPVHRLDRAASGVIVFALSGDGARELQASLSRAETRKEYLVLVRGETPPAWTVERPLTGESGEKQAARSEFHRLGTFSRCSLLRARIVTGRRHQIRRHLSACAHQVIGDSSYGKGRINRFFRAQYELPRLFLHSFLLALRHPRTGNALELRAPLAADLRAFLDRLPDFDPAVLRGGLRARRFRRWTGAGAKVGSALYLRGWNSMTRSATASIFRSARSSTSCGRRGRRTPRGSRSASAPAPAAAGACRTSSRSTAR
jgi:tRNA pseudouridine65 synthase